MLGDLTSSVQPIEHQDIWRRSQQKLQELVETGVRPGVEGKGHGGRIQWDRHRRTIGKHRTGLYKTGAVRADARQFAIPVADGAGGQYRRRVICPGKGATDQYPHALPGQPAAYGGGHRPFCRSFSSRWAGCGRSPIWPVLSVSRAGDAEIQRENLQSMGVVSARQDNRDLGSVIKDIQRRIGAQVSSRPGGYHIEYGGDYALRNRSPFVSCC